MNNKKSTSIKAFTCLSRQNYYSAIKHTYNAGIADRIMFGNYDSNNCGCEYEAAMEWIVLNGEHTSPRLGVFNDSFKVFEDHNELFDELKKLHGKDFSPDEFSRLLIKLGYKDLSDNPLEK